MRNKYLLNNRMNNRTSEDKQFNQPHISKELENAKNEAVRLAREAIEARERAKKEAWKAKKAKEEEKKARKEAGRLAREKAKREAAKKEETKKIDQKLYEGEVELLILPPVDSKNLKKLEDGLRITKGLKILLTGGTADGGIQIVVSVVKPMPILNTLREMPQVGEAIDKDDTIHISLK